MIVTLLLSGLFFLPRVAAISIPQTNTYHLTITCDTVTNAQWYSVVVSYKGVDAFRRYSMTNTITVSNLSSDLGNYRFTMTATNSIGESEESLPAATKLVTVQISDDLTNWKQAPSVIYDPSTNTSRFLRLSNWNAATLLKLDQ